MSLEEIFSHIRTGQMIVIVSGDTDEAEGDLVMAAEKITPAHVNFMVREARGIVSVAIPEKRMREAAPFLLIPTASRHPRLAVPPGMTPSMQKLRDPNNRHSSSPGAKKRGGRQHDLLSPPSERLS